MKCRFVRFGGVALLLSAASLTLGARGPQQSAVPDTEPVSAVARHQAVVNRYCLSCHNDKVKTGGLTLSSASVANLGEHTEIWEKVARKLQGRAMPPMGRPRPDTATYESLVAHLETSLDRIAAANPTPGRTETFRRLTRTEYRNVIRDLLGVDVEVASLLPPDDVRAEEQK